VSLLGIIISKLLAKHQKETPCSVDLALKQGVILSLVAHTGFATKCPNESF
jgi:hypothetical protein